MPIRLGGLREILSHADLSDMPDVGGTVADHDARYYTEAEVNALLAALAALYLKIDQTTPQTVINGRPIFDEGIKATSTGNDAIILTAGKRLVFDGA